MSPSPVPQSVLVAGHQLDFLAARPTDSGFHVCKVNSGVRLTKHRVCSVNCWACDACSTNNHRVCSVNCQVCDTRTTNIDY